jgi:hypothetical protein
MIKFKKPVNLNGAELIAELKSASVEISNSPEIDGNGDFWLDIATKDEAKAKSVVEAHNGTTTAPEPTVADKLANAGLTVEDLKAALGL